MGKSSRKLQLWLLFILILSQAIKLQKECNKIMKEIEDAHKTMFIKFPTVTKLIYPF